ncbi:MAG: 4'-phosphopantetheinyl transferase superfamily protein [Gammaproteobacteria bacterium]|nr:4'-phosphopantetheinyl transferase superfamily protein [Gammaproteobacteria bacterium]
MCQSDITCDNRSLFSPGSSATAVTSVLLPEIAITEWSEPSASIVCATIDLEKFRRDWFIDERLPPLLIESLTVDEIHQFERFPIQKRRLEWLAGRLAAKYALRHFRGGSSALSATTIRRQQNGRPFIDDQTYLSISHCRRYAVAAIGNVPLGIDTELCAAVRAQSLSELVLATEVAAVMTTRQCDNQQARTLIWSLKEALYKACGEGSFAAFAQNIFLTDWQEPVSPRWQCHEANALADPRHWCVQSRLTDAGVNVLVYRSGQEWQL